MRFVVALILFPAFAVADDVLPSQRTLADYIVAFPAVQVARLDSTTDVRLKIKYETLPIAQWLSEAEYYDPSTTVYSLSPATPIKIEEFIASGSKVQSPGPTPYNRCVYLLTTDPQQKVTAIKKLNPDACPTQDVQKQTSTPIAQNILDGFYQVDAPFNGGVPIQLTAQGWASPQAFGEIMYATSVDRCRSSERTVYSLRIFNPFTGEVLKEEKRSTDWVSKD